MGKKDMQSVRAMLTMDNADDYELDNPKEKVDFSYFGDSPSYLETKKLPPIKIYIYGNYPHFEKATAYFMLKKAGVQFSNQFQSNYFDIGWFWDARISVDKNTKNCRERSKELRFINLFLIETSKEYVAKSMEAHFGYTFKINPRTFNGYCIAKHNGNGTKSCFFLKCPIDADEVFADHCYQKIINFSSKTDKSTLYEIRVPVFRNIIPFTFFKTRNRGLRFTSKNRSMEITPALTHLSADELQDIITYCRKIGLEYGELDILRDDEDGKIYIIDVNNTAWWPPNKLGDIDRNIALNMMWNGFLEAFLPNKFDQYHIPDEYIDDFYNSKNPNRNYREKKNISYNGFKFVGKPFDLPYMELWQELNKEAIRKGEIFKMKQARKQEEERRKLEGKQKKKEEQKVVQRPQSATFKPMQKKK